MNARIVSIRDDRHQDSEKLPVMVLWVPGDEIAESIKATALFVGGATTLLLGKKHYSVFLQSVQFGNDKDAQFRVRIEDGQQLGFNLGDSVEIAFSEGGRYGKA